MCGICSLLPSLHGFQGLISSHQYSSASILCIEPSWSKQLWPVPAVQNHGFWFICNCSFRTMERGRALLKIATLLKLVHISKKCNNGDECPSDSELNRKKKISSQSSQDNVSICFWRVLFLLCCFVFRPKAWGWTVHFQAALSFLALFPSFAIPSPTRLKISTDSLLHAIHHMLLASRLIFQSWFCGLKACGSSLFNNSKNGFTISWFHCFLEGEMPSFFLKMLVKTWHCTSLLESSLVLLERGCNPHQTLTHLYFKIRATPFPTLPNHLATVIKSWLKDI